jgi:hypothetical protein
MLITNSLEDVVCSMIDKSRLVNRSAYMDFKKATDELFSRVTQDDLAESLGVSVALIRQARLSPAAKAHRSPPEGWEKAATRLATEQAKRFSRLAERLRKAD